MAGSDPTTGSSLLRFHEAKPEADESREGLKPALGSLYRLCIDSAPHGVLIHDDTGRILLYNRQLELITGYSLDEIPDTPTWIETIYPDPVYRSLVIQAHQDALSEGGIRTREAMITRKDGHMRMCRFMSSRPSAGLRIVFISDIHTAPGAGDGRLPGSGTPGESPVAVLNWAHRGEGFFLCGFDGAAETWAGGSLAGRLAAEVGELFPGRDDLREDMRRCLKDRTSFRRKMLFPFRSKYNGTYVAGTYTVHPPDFITLQLEDLTDLLRAEQKLEQSERKFIDFADMLPEIVFEADLKGRLRFVNRSGLELMGYTAEDLKQELVAFDFVHPQDRPRAQANFREVLRGADLGVSEYTLVRRDGRTFPALLRSRLLVEGEAGVGVCGFIIDISARKQAEDALRTSEEKFSLAFQASPNGFAITTFDEGRYLDCNTSECLMTGYSREELIGRTTAELNYFADPAVRGRLLRMLEDEGAVHNFEFQFRCKSGEIRTGLFSAAVITLSGRRCILGEVADCTEQKRAEKALKLSEERLWIATEGARLGLWAWDIEEGSIYCSDQYFRMLGYSPGELTPTYESWLELIHPDDRAEVEQCARAGLMQGAGVISAEYRMRQRDGSWRWIKDLGHVAERNADGTPRRALGVHFDITERKQMEAALHESEERLRLAVEAARIGIHATDIDTGKILWSQELYNIAGRQPGTMTNNEEALKVIHLDDRTRVLQARSRALDPAGDGLSYTEHRIVRPSGEVRWIAWQSRTVFRNTSSGRVPARRIGACIDITERKLAEEELYRARDELEERVRERTAALEELNESLRRENSARRTAEDELRARTEELAEINNALRVFLRKSREECEENTVKMAASIRQLAYPHLEKLKLAHPTGKQAAYLHLLEEALSEVTSPDFSSLSDLQRKLTPAEYQVAWLIRQGKTSKQLSEILSLSCRTIESHRKSIRKKLGLQHSKTNLRSHLSSIRNHTS